MNNILKRKNYSFEIESFRKGMIAKMNIDKVLYNLNYKLLMKNYILMESNPDFGDNTKAVFDEFIKRGINKKFKIIWFVDNRKKFADIKIHNVKFIQRDRNFFNLIKFIYYSLISKYIIDCNKCIKKRNKNQFRIYLTHGAPLKLAVDYCRSVGKFDYVIQTSDFFTEANCKLFLVEKEKVLSTGFPRNDAILDKKQNIILYKEIKRNKTVFWFPTYRNHKSIKHNSKFNMDINFPYGIPTIENEEQIYKLNEVLKKDSILLIIKLHPAEDISQLHFEEYSNIKLLKDEFFEKGHTNLYQLLGNADALITDYSSIYYDYLITERPIGLAIPDIDEYRKHVDLLFDNFEENIPGELIYNFDDLVSFFDNLNKNIDKTLWKRKEAKKIYHKYDDGNSSKRVVEILEEHIEGEEDEKGN